jgi:hypothetical protein
VVVHVLFSNQTVIADGKSMIRRKEDVRVVSFPGLVKRVEDSSDLLIQVRDQCVVFTAMNLDGVFGSRASLELI